jgi:hypothetical protein
MQKFVPTTPELDLEKLGFRREIISAFVQERRVPGSQPRAGERSSDHTLSTDTLPSERTCVSGRGGEAFIDSGDKAYQGSNPLIHGIVTNAGCDHPCLLNKDHLMGCCLNPGPFKRLMWAILVEAWKMNHKFPEPMQPENLLITCDAYIVGDVVWTPFKLTRFAKPRPNDTFEATINWIFLHMDAYTGRRMDSFSRSIALGNLDTLRKVLLCPRSIDNKFQLSRSENWKLEQICFIIDSVTEDPYVFCRDNHCVESDGEEVQCFAIKKRKRRDTTKKEVSAENLLKPRKRVRQGKGKEVAS